MNTGITTERRYVNKSQDWETRYSKGKKWRKGYNGNRRFDVGGELPPSNLEQYFASLDFSLLPTEFANYIENEIINDTDLNTISMNDPIVIELIEKVEDYIAGTGSVIEEDGNETQEAINLLMELVEAQDGEEKQETLEAIELLKELLDI